MNAFMLRGWRLIRDSVLNPPADRHDDEAIAASALAQAPVVWMMGKTQSGKSSIIHAITGHPEAQIGTGYRPCTESSRVFDFPEDAPVIRFLDTVGFDAVGYDPAQDLALLDQTGHVLLAVVRAMDPSQQALKAALVRIRSQRPELAVIVAQTALHEGYPDGYGHPDYAELMGRSELHDLQRALSFQREMFAGLPGMGSVTFVPVDFTRTEDGYAETRFGLEAFLDALSSAGSAGMQTLLDELVSERADSRRRRARGHVLGYATVAGASDTLPILGAISVPTIQGKMLHSIGRIYDVRWDRRTIAEFAASLGAGTVLGIGLGLGARQLVKLIPGYGQTLGAAAAGLAGFTVTWALGMAACHYLGVRRTGSSVPVRDVRRVYEKALKEALDMAREGLQKHVA